MNKICPVCGKQFEIDDKRKKYCSAECARRSHLEQARLSSADCREQRRYEEQHKYISQIVHRIVSVHKIKTIDEMVTEIMDKYYIRRYNKDK